MLRRVIGILCMVCMLFGVFGAVAEEVIPPTSNQEIRSILPSVEYWGEHPTQNLPNPFEMLDGTVVKTTEDWEKRAAEIKEMIQYYEYGYKPAAPDTLTVEYGVLQYKAFDWATWSFLDKEVDGMTITMTVEDREAVMQAGVQLPETPMPEGGYPAIICFSSLGGTSASLFLSRGYAVIGLNVSEIYNEQTGDGVVKTLYQFDWLNDPNAPSSMMGWAWGASRLIDALEVDGYQGKINVKQLAITGTSRNGQGALVAGAYDERIAVVDPVNAGCGGTALERFISPLLEPDYYFYTPNPEEPFNSIVVQPGYEDVIGVRKWTLSEGSQDAWNEEEQRYVPRYQTLSHCREQQDLWFCSRFQQFKQDESIICDPVDIHKWTTQDERVNPMEWEDGYDGPGYGGNGTPFGVIYSIPFDQHYLMALVAPRGLMIHTGYTDDWNSAEGMAFGYYVGREIYRYFDVLNGTENEYANRINLYAGDWGHAFPDYAAHALCDFCNYMFQLDGEVYEQKATYTGYPYPDQDPRRAIDYERLNWSAQEPEVKAVSIEVDAVTVKAGETAKLSAKVTPDNATGVRQGLAFASSDEAIVTVDAEGCITGVAAGEAVITVSFGELAAECAVTVE